MAEQTGQLDQELKTFGRLAGYSRQHRSRGRAVEREVQLHQWKVPAIADEHLLGASAGRVKRPHPVRVRVARSANPDVHKEQRAEDREQRTENRKQRTATPTRYILCYHPKTQSPGVCHLLFVFCLLSSVLCP